jgi:hypothetical protein
VVDVDQKEGKFFIAPIDTEVPFSSETPYDERTYATSKKLELKAGKDFHTLTSVKDDRVKVDFANHNGSVVMKGIEGRVVGFDPGKMSYTVAVPQVTVPIGQVERKDRSVKAWHKRGSDVPSQFDKPLVGKHIMMRVGQEWTSGQILGFHPKPGRRQATLKDYTYDLMADEGERQVNDAEWPRDWHEPAGFAQANDVQVNWEVLSGVCDGTEIGSQTAELPACKALCAKTPSCVAIQHDTSDDSCTTFSGVVSEGDESASATCYKKVGTLSSVYLHKDHEKRIAGINKLGHKTWMDDQRWGTL